jgi:hypothetical protein
MATQSASEKVHTKKASEKELLFVRLRVRTYVFIKGA